MSTANHRRRRNAPPAPAVAPSPSRSWLLALPLLLAITVTFSPLILHQFTTWDDYRTLAKNPHFNPLTLTGLLSHWSSPHMELYIPITYTLWGALAALAQLDHPLRDGILLNPAFFHTANLLLHAASTLLVLAILRRLLHHDTAAVFGAALFALHPLQVETVAWISGMKDLLMGFFCLLSLWHYLLFRSDPACRRRLHYALAFTFFLLALLSKPTAVILPAILAALDSLLLQQLPRKILTSLAPWLIPALGCAILIKIVQPDVLALASEPLWFRPFVAGDALAFYLCKLLAPFRLAIDYGRNPAWLLQQHWSFFTPLIPVALAIVLFIARRKIPHLLASACIFVIALLPVLGLVHFEFQRYSTVADHYLYLPMLGVALAFGWGISLNRGRTTLALGLAILLLLAFQSWTQTRHWHDTRTLFTHTLDINPKSFASAESLASEALTAADPLRAESFARLAIDLKPDRAPAHELLGSSLYAQGKLQPALDAYQASLRLSPDNPGALASLGGILAQRDQLDQALPLLTKAVQLDPTHPIARRNFGTALAQSGDWSRAETELRIAVQLDWGNVEGHSNLAAVLNQLNQLDQAIAEYRTALRLNPNFPPAQSGLTNTLRRRAQQ